MVEPLAKLSLLRGVLHKLIFTSLIVILVISVSSVTWIDEAQADYFKCYAGCSRALEDSNDCKRSEGGISGDYKIVDNKSEKDVIVLAIHAGLIELNTGQIAERIRSKNNWDSYMFFGNIRNEACRNLVRNSTRLNFDVLHITSEKFNDPAAIEAVGSHKKSVSIHGHRRDHAPGSICVGGLNKAQRNEFITYVNRNRSSFSLYHLNPIDAPSQTSGDCSEANLKGISLYNIVNKNSSEAGLQLELNSQMRQDLVKTGADYKKLQQIIYSGVAQAMSK